MAQRLSVDEEELVEEARAFFEIGDYVTVRKLLEPYVSDFNTDAEIMYFFGGASFYLQEYHNESFPFLRMAYRKGEMRALYIYVRSLIEQYQILEAKRVLEKSGALELPEGRELYEQVRTAERLMSAPVASSLAPLVGSVNSKYTEHSPLITNDDSTLYFTSRRPADKNRITDMVGLYDENIYRSIRTDDGWSEPELLGGDVNDILNDAAVTLLSDESRMIVFKTARDVESANLYIYSEQRKGRWKKEEKLNPSINSDWIENGLTVNTNGDMFIVASDRPGGYGGMDLYRIVRFGNGDYSEPINLGPLVNTVYDEVSPNLLLDDQTLFFSRNGPHSMGGFDIFRTTYLGDTLFTEVDNVGFPINSTRDDLHITISPKTRRAYLTRSKDIQPADYDIYSANMPGFNLQATVYKFRLTADEDFDPYSTEVSLFTNDFSELRGMYTVNEDGYFVVVLLPGERGILAIDCPGMLSEEVELEYQDSELITEIDEVIKLTRDAP